MTRTTLLTLALSLGCARPAIAPPAPPAPQPEASRCAAAPMTARWTAVSKRPHGVGTRLTLEGVIELPGVTPGPVIATMRVPEGAAAASPVTLALGAHAQGERVPIRFEVDYASTPSKDLSVEIDARDGDDFAHVLLAYRFGRPAPELALPRFEGPHAVLLGRDLGPSVADGITSTTATTAR